MIQAELEAAARAPEETRSRIVRSLASAAKQSSATYEQLLPILLEDKELSGIVETVFGAVGFPENRTAIPALLYHVSNANSPAAFESLEVLREIPAPAVVPYVVEILWDRGATNKWWRNDVQGLGYALRQLGPEYGRPCGPMIAYLLSDREARDKLYLPALLQLITAIGPEYASYALPALIQVVDEYDGTDIGNQARTVLEAFGESDMAPYSKIINVKP